MEAPKKTYEAPRLVTYGEVEKLTGQQVGGAKRLNERPNRPGGGSNERPFGS